VDAGVRPDRPHFSLAVDRPASRRIDRIDDGYFSIVLNTNPYTYLGNRPLDLSPAATLGNPLVVLTFRTLRVLPIVRGLGSALRGGGVRESTHLTEWRDVEHMVVEHATPFPYQVDGDYLGDVNRLEFSYVRDAVRLVFPAADSDAGERS
jgi:diacylglycerol kinase family enzyme